MPTNTFKVFGQSAPAATTNTDIYTVPSATSAIVKTLTACNRGTANATVNVAVRPNGATLANQHYVAFEFVVAPKDSINLAYLVPPIDAADVITVQASTANFSFTCGGVETA